MVRPADSLTLLIGASGLLFTVGYWQSASGTPQDSAVVKSDDTLIASEAKAINKSEADGQDSGKQTKAPLYGCLIDDAGKPVTDAKLTLSSEKQQGGRRDRITTEVDEKGNYSFDEIPEKGSYILRIDSKRWLGLTEYDEKPRLTLSPDTATRRDFTLQRACRMIVRAVDEETNLPVKGVQLYVALITADQHGYMEPVMTDDDGSVTITRPKAPGGKYLVGAVHEGYALDHLTQALDDPDLVPRRTFSLKRGKTLVGHAVCNDGKPPAGWQIYALPTWWKFGVYLRSGQIDADGEFRLDHIAPETYDVMISIPLGAQRPGGDMSTMSYVLSKSDLTEIKEPIEVKMDYPSPSSLVYISGKLTIEGDLPKGERILLGAQPNSLPYSYHGSIAEGQTDFRLGPLPKGVYSINFFSSNIESTTLKGIEAPRDDIEVKVRPRSKPKIQGVVLSDQTGKPLDQFHVRVTRVGSFGGPVYYLDPSWKNISDKDGAFSFDVLSSGEYQVSALAEGFGLLTSETINTNKQADKLVTLRLKPGFALNGVVIDESGNSISGATVSSLTLAPKENWGIAAQLDQAIGSVATIDGRFSLTNLAEGKESLRVTHPDFCFLEVNGIDVKAGPNPELKLTLTRGATVTGRFYNEEGKPQANVPIAFHQGAGYEFFRRKSANLFASVVTDRDGFYKAQHLPSQRIYVSRELTSESLGVTRRTVVIENAQSTTLDFGGSSRVTGRIRVNGLPLLNTRIQIGSGTSGLGIMHQYAMTDGDGQFDFRGIAPGLWTLSFQMPSPLYGWVQLKEVEVPASGSADLGLIEQQTGQVTVNMTDAPLEQLDNLFLQLTTYEFGSVSYETAGSQVKRAGASDPFLFESVPPGEYAITAYLKNVQLLQRLTVTEQNLNPTVTVKFPTGTASLVGSIDQDVVEPGQRQSLTLWSVDGSWRSGLQPKSDGTFQVENLPGGKYEIRIGYLQNTSAIESITVSDGEKKSIHLTADAVKQAAGADGNLSVKVYTKDGIPTPCRIRLEGRKGPLIPKGRFSETTNYAGTPGTYYLTTKLAGFKPVTRAVQIDSPNAKPTEIKLELERLTD